MAGGSGGANPDADGELGINIGGAAAGDTTMGGITCGVAEAARGSPAG
jgi:hypothetical protein